MKTGHLNNMPGLLRRFHMGHHDRRGIRLERLHIVAVAALFHPHDGVHIVELGGPNLVLQVEPIVGDMLVAKPYRGSAGEAAELDDPGITQIQFEAGWPLAGSEFPQDTT